MSTGGGRFVSASGDLDRQPTALPNAAGTWHYVWTRRPAAMPLSQPATYCVPVSTPFGCCAQRLACGWRSCRTTVMSYGVTVTVPEPVPDASALPEEPPLRSEHIDLTRAIKRCRTWQELRRLYWTHRTRQGVVNVVSYFTRLAALLPDLPGLLAGEDEDDEVAVATEDGRTTDVGGPFTGVGAAAPRGGSGGSRGGDGGGGGDAREPGSAKTPWRRQQQQSQSGRRVGGRAAASPPPLRGLTERAALRQLVVRMVYDACSFTEEHVAAGRLDELLRGLIDPWDTEVYALYLAESDAAEKQRQRARGTGGAGGPPPGGGSRRPEDAVPDQSLQSSQQRGPLTFWEWLRDRPELWTDPVASAVTGGLRHWDPTLAVAERGGARSPAAAAAAPAARRRTVPLCYGPLELATLAWAAARLQLHRAVPEHAAWLLHDLLHASYRQMPDFDGRQLAQLSYSLSQMGPCVPSARWRRRFLAAARRRMSEMDPQSLANLAHSLEPLDMSPDPAWLRRLLVVSGPMLEGGALSASELTQLGWAVFSLRRRLCRVRRWANEILQVSRSVVKYGTRSVGTSQPVSSSVAVPSTAGPRGGPVGGMRAPQGIIRSGAGATRLLDFLSEVLEEIGAPVLGSGLQELQQLLAARPLSAPAAATPPPPPPDASRDGTTPSSSSTSAIADIVTAPMGQGVRTSTSGWSDVGGSDPWVSNHAAALLLAVVAQAGQPYGRVAAWLLRQPLLVFMLTRLWAEQATGLRADHEQGEGDGVQDGDENKSKEDSEIEALLAGVEAELRREQMTDAAFDLSTYTARYLKAVGTLPEDVLEDGEDWLALPGAATAEPPAAPATSLAAAVGAGVAASASIAPMMAPDCLPRTHVTPSPPKPQLESPEPASSSWSPPSGPGARIASAITGAAEAEAVNAADAGAGTPVLLLLHTRCWPGPRWLEALAGAATAQLNTPGFRAQSSGMLLWSLAGLGYSPPSGWLQPWLRRATELAADFRPANLVSVLCALSAWGELPTGRPAAALRTTAVRLLPSMDPRELQLTASALAQLCELPPQAPPPPPAASSASSSRVPRSPAVQGSGGEVDSHRGRDDRYGGVGSGGSGSSGGVGKGLFVPLPAVRSSSSSLQQPMLSVTRSARSGALAATTGGLISGVYDIDDDDDGIDDDGVLEGDIGVGYGRQPPPLPPFSLPIRHRRIDPRVGKLLVQRAVEVSYSYSPRHMTRMLQLLALRLGCLERLEELRAILYGNATHLERLAAAGLRQRRRRQTKGRGRGNASVSSPIPDAPPEGSPIPCWDASDRRSNSGRGAASAPTRGGVLDVGDIQSDSGLGSVGELLSRRRELRELLAAALDAVRAVASAGARSVAASLKDEEAAALLPGRWWRAYLAALESVEG